MGGNGGKWGRLVGGNGGRGVVVRGAWGGNVHESVQRGVKIACWGRCSGRFLPPFAIFAIF